MASSIRSTRTAIASAAALATISTAVAVTPAASAWETTYDAEGQKCTISFTDAEQQRVNDAWKVLFTAMAEQTGNAQLKQSFTDAANDPFLDTAKIEGISPAQAQAQAGLFYGVELSKIALPYGVQGVVENLNVEQVAAAAAPEIIKAIDVDAIVAAADLEGAISEIPAEAIAKDLATTALGNLELKKYLSIPTNPLKLAALAGDLANDPKKVIGELVETEQLLNDVKDNVTKDAVKRALKNNGVDLKQIGKDVLADEKFQAAVKEELGKVDFAGILKDAMKAAGTEPSIEGILGYSVSDVTSAGTAAFKAVGPQVTAPILTMRDAFNSCGAPGENPDKLVGSSGFRSSSESNVVSGSIAPGSSLDAKGFAIVSAVTAVLGLLAVAGIGFAARPAIDNLITKYL